MELLQRLEQHLSLPGDEETIRRQKVVAMLAGITGLVSSIGLATINFALGIDRIGWLYALTVVFMLFAILGLYFFPRHYPRWVLIAALFVCVHPWFGHLASGGFRSGLNVALWSIFGPFAAVILIGPRPALLAIGTLLAAAFISAFLEPLVAGLEPVLSERLRISISLFNVLTPSLMIFISGLYLFRVLEMERNRSEQLLLNILPAPIAWRLKRDNSTIAQSHDAITVLFADIVDFTRLSSGADPAAVVNVLNDVFSDFDDLADQYRLEKIKTIGDAYMVVAGLPQARPDHLEAIVLFAIDILAVAGRHRAWNGEPICLRVGIHTGPVVAGVIGRRKFIYDLWGDTVNTASRMESHGLSNTIQVTEAVRQRLDGRYVFEPRGPIEVKGKGFMMTYLLKLDETGRPIKAEPIPDVVSA
jgi:guanylate cyclase